MSIVKIYDTRYNDFNSVDWDFISPSKDISANIHPYPARFINNIPKELIRLLGCESGNIIFDPFCGSGTTLREAQICGIKSTGIDLNPIACLISKVRTSKLPNDFMNTACYVRELAEKNLTYDIDIPPIPNLNHWFKIDIQMAIASLLNQINKIGDEIISDALRLSLSSIIVRMSNQDSDTRYAAVSNNYNSNDVFCSFIAACRKTENGTSHDESTKIPVNIICRDVLKVKSQDIGNNVGLVITSPPYPNAYEYWLYHKYRMWWLGYDPIQVRSYEIGARPNYHKKNGQTAEDFERQMESVFDLFVPILANDGHVCFVIGRSIIRGQEIDNAQLIQRVASHHDLHLVADIEREIASTKKSFNLKYGKIKTENIMVFRKR